LSTPRYRLAPTPSGYLHAGNAFNFILTAATARMHPQGRLLLRIDDMDADRKRPEYVTHIFRTLERLQIEWDEGPTGPDAFEQYWSQRHRMAIYEVALQQLRSKDLLFPCQRSRKDLAALPSDYPPEFRDFPLNFDQPDTAWRANTPPDAPLPAFIVRRRDGLPAYQLTSICDDLHFGITHIIRGEDLLASTQAQLWLAQMADWTAFNAIYVHHHPLVLDGDGQKISKSTGAVPVESVPTHRLFQQVADYLKISESVADFEGLVKAMRQSSTLPIF
jgi:glutamyl-tRNA synthetase